MRLAIPAALGSSRPWLFLHRWFSSSAHLLRARAVLKTQQLDQTSAHSNAEFLPRLRPAHKQSAS
jgi:hypothetical protein